MRNFVISTLVACTLAACASTPAAPAGYVGTWQLQSIGDQQVVGPRGASLTLDAQGHANGNGGCNSFGGQYTARDNTLTFSRMISTMMACVSVDGGDDVMTQERAMLSILNGTVRASGAGDDLALSALDGRTLHFHRAAGQ